VLTIKITPHYYIAWVYMYECSVIAREEIQRFAIKFDMRSLSAPFTASDQNPEKLS